MIVKQKKLNIRKKIHIILSVVILVGISLVFLLPFSRFYVGSNVTGTIQVTVNGNYVMPENITCTDGTDRIEQVRVNKKENYIIVKCKAFHYNGYRFDYDVETEDGTKSFQFMVFKCHHGGPVEEFCYQMELNKENDEWIADVSLLDENGMGKVNKILLKEDSTAFIQLGP